MLGNEVLKSEHLIYLTKLDWFQHNPIKNICGYIQYAISISTKWRDCTWYL